MSELALLGGPAAAADLEFQAGSWPRPVDAEAEAQVLEVLRSGRWCRLHADSYAEKFENAFAAYQDARISGLTSSLALLAFVAVIGLFVAQRIPRKQPQ